MLIFYKKKKGDNLLGLSNKKVLLTNYSGEWKEEYKKEAQQLSQLLVKWDVHIQHIGSTSIPNICSKPIIDIAVGVKSEDDMQEIKELLIKKGYNYCPNAGSIDRFFFAKGEEQCRTHNIHVEIYGGISWQNHIVFRDYMINHPEIATEYSCLKRILAKRYENERKKYTEAKDNFIKNILEISNLV